MELVEQPTANRFSYEGMQPIDGSAIAGMALRAPYSATGSTAVVNGASSYGHALRWATRLKPTAFAGATYSLDKIADQDLLDHILFASPCLNAGVDAALMLWRLAEIPPPSGSRLQVRVRADVPRGGARITAKTPADLIAEIKAAFGLSVSQLARVMNVQRPTIYSWLDEQQGPNTIRAANKGRLVKLADFATLWRRMSPAPCKTVLDQHLIGGKSLVEWLAQEPLNDDVVSHILEAFAREFRDERSKHPPSLAEQLSAKGFVEVPKARRGPLER